MARTMASPLTGLGAAIQRQSTTEQAAAALRDAILSGEIPPGTPLREAALAAELGVSRNTLREAARLLGGEGLVRHQMNRGIVVAEITAADVRDIYAARAAIETAAAQALTAHRDPAIYQRLESLAGQIEDAFAQDDAAGNVRQLFGSAHNWTSRRRSSPPDCPKMAWARRSNASVPIPWMSRPSSARNPSRATPRAA